MDQQDLSDLRREYGSRPLRRDDLRPDPMAQFQQWFDEAQAAEAIEPNAMTVATVSADGQPSARTVLLKYYDQDGFVFYTNHGSRKAQEIAGNPNAALLFVWHEVHRQVKVRGTVERISSVDTLKYFRRRPRKSQIGAWVSEQSKAISTRAVLEKAFAQMKERFAGGDVPLPDFWGGYRVRPQSIEFWQGRESRLHDRFEYQRVGESNWAIQRLAP